MEATPVISIRGKDGLTSVCYVNKGLLTSSIGGGLSIWDMTTGNTLTSSHIHRDCVYALPIDSNGQNCASMLAVQHKSGFSVFDLKTDTTLYNADVNYSNFSHICFCSSASLLLCPSGINSIACYDVRTAIGSSDHQNGATGPSSISIELLAPTEGSTDIGCLQHIETFPHSSGYRIIAGYETGLVSIFDLRKPQHALMTHTVDGIDTLTAFSVWRDVVLLGDSIGNVSMLHISSSSDVTTLKSHNIYKGEASTAGIGCLKIRPDGAITIACCWDYTIRVLETRSLYTKAIIAEHNDTIVDVCFNAQSGDFATCGLDGNAYA
uniref:Guanine nucleotide-binding protein subunit beta-like protein 1 n=1 Tax=Babesia bovis TaxID=5865 RepID=S6C9A7_BABBO|nr:guanine nucleotide-binding protein subunit beta-like protein 1 [Babesia bovis]